MSQDSTSAFRTFINALRSIWIWTAIVLLIVFWYPLLALIRIFDRDPVRYRTGRWFRRLGVVVTKVNPAWKLHVDGFEVDDPRRPYVVVSNHQSNADIPLISHLPWEMKWVGKKELFRLPFVGWMMGLAGDISVDRGDRKSGVRALMQARWYLDQKCSVMFFPEGTRSRDGRLLPFKDGAFRLAVKAQVPILPLVVDGSQDALPKHTWIFKTASTVSLTVLPPIETAGLTAADVPALSEQVRQAILESLAARRGVSLDVVDSTTHLLG